MVGANAVRPPGGPLATVHVVTQSVTMRAMNDGDAARVISLNNAHVPAVGHLDDGGLAALRAMAMLSTVVEVDGAFAGCFIVLGPGQSYASLNYRWFDQRYEDFAYLDRIVVDQAFHRRGLGRACYDYLIARVGSTPVCCEVNIRPLNQGSIDFHRALGFREVGQQDTEGGAKRVSLLWLDRSGDDGST